MTMTTYIADPTFGLVSLMLVPLRGKLPVDQPVVLTGLSAESFPKGVVLRADGDAIQIKQIGTQATLWAMDDEDGNIEIRGDDIFAYSLGLEFLDAIRTAYAARYSIVDGQHRTPSMKWQMADHGHQLRIGDLALCLLIGVDFRDPVI